MDSKPVLIMPVQSFARMTIAETMSRGFGFKNEEWCYLDGSKAGPPCLELMNAPKSTDDALKILRMEEAARSSDEYINQTKKYIKNQTCPPRDLDIKLQRQALMDCGFSSDTRSVYQYQSLVASMTAEQRSEISFLKLNDELFKP